MRQLTPITALLCISAIPALAGTPGASCSQADLQAWAKMSADDLAKLPAFSKGDTAFQTAIKFDASRLTTQFSLTGESIATVETTGTTYYPVFRDGSIVALVVATTTRDRCLVSGAGFDRLAAALDRAIKAAGLP